MNLPRGILPAGKLRRHTRGEISMEVEQLVVNHAPSSGSRDARPLIGILEGEGIGPEVIRACLPLLDAVRDAYGLDVELRYGGAIGKDAIAECGVPLSREVQEFCDSIFASGGALFCGPGGGRFVYDLRLRFGLYCKLVPLRPLRALQDAAVLKPSLVEGVDILVVRENLGGLYQGSFGMDEHQGLRRARHCFQYDEEQVRQILDAAGRLAVQRRGELCVVTKPGGVPSISELWREGAEALVRAIPLNLRMLEVDNACYQVLADPRSFDVVVAPNMFGDVLADTAALLLASRGMSYSANFGPGGRAVYQTGHGAAHDLAGTGRANPLGQMQSLAMLLRESFRRDAIAGRVLEAIEATLAAGWRTADIMAPGCHEVGTLELGQRVAEAFLHCEEGRTHGLPRAASLT
jgi:3-isopropylmalate dehydrogenase